MPGTNVTTATRTGPAAIPRPRSGRYFLAGITERGPVDRSVIVRSVADLVRVFGARVTYGAVYDDVVTFIEEGGGEAVVSRVVPAAGTTVGTLTLSSATPTTVARVDAANPGAWSTGVTVEVLAGTTAGTARVIVRHAAAPGGIALDANNVTGGADLASKASGNEFVKVTDLGGAGIPAPIAATPLSAGNDNRAAIAVADYATALTRFGRELGDGAVSIPGQPSSAVGAILDAHAKANNRLALLAAARSTTQANLITAAAALNSESSGLFAPWVLVPDGAGGSRAISPEGYVAAMRARAHDTEGPYRAPAGVIAVARYVVGLDQAFDRTAGDALDLGRVSAIRSIAGTTRLYGWRSLSQDEANYALLTGRDMLNRISVAAELESEDYVFATVDGRGLMLGRLAGDLVGIVEPYAAAGGLFARLDPDGKVLDPGYRVQADARNNPVESLANNVVNADISIRVSPVGSLINVRITKAGLTAAV
jgi:hypothetical protein